MVLDNLIILFDLDGTLIDSTEAILESFNHVYDVYSKDKIDDKYIEILIGHPLEYMFEHLGFESFEIENAVKTYKNYYKDIAREKTVLLEYAKEAVVEANKFARLGIVTTKTGLYSRQIMEHFSLMQYFEVLVGSEDVKNLKPHPEPILKALNLMNSDTKNVCMIGDTNLDVKASLNAQIEPYAVASGYESEKSLRIYTNNISPNVYEAVKKIAKRFK